ncbi:hypothetical protein CYMTET_7336 [Cymbomonas tetramitiformis]|uniref:Spen paralogue and orthologue SPOC C-terminal domain-containing protein n=1 Tax=Cymbomonas tetramitiformis TaxID=36881 RepID=A0AAE0GVV7_9CHLO|nr:hypothetical protein CYMTET_7336 [Cymbomonas tetramitiformis]
MFPAQLPDFSSVRVHAEASLPAFQSFSDFAEQPAKPDAASRAPLPECHSFQERAEQANGEAPSTSFLPKFHSFEERAEQANGEAPSTSTRYGRPNGSDASEDSADEMMTEVLEEMTSAHSREQRVEPLVPVKNHGETTSSAHPAPSAKAKRGWASRRTTTGAAEDRSAKASPAAAAGDEDTWTGKLQLPGKTSGLDVTMRCSGCNVDSAPSLGLPSLLQVKGRIRLSVLEGFVGSLKSKNTSRTLTVLRVQATEGASFKDTKRVLHMEATELSDQERAFVLEPFKGLELYLLPECPLAKSLDTGVGGGALIGILIRRKAAKRSKDLGGSSSPTSEFPRASSKSPSRGKSPTAHTAVSKDPRLSRSEQQPLIADPSPRTTPPYTTMRPSACPRDPPASTSPMPNSSESSTPEVEVQEAKPWSGSTAVDRVVPGAGAVPGGRENTGAALDQSAASALNDLLALVGGVDTHMSTSSTAPPSDAGGLETAQMPLAPLMLGSQQAEQRLPMSMKESAAAAPLCLQAAPSPSEAARALPVSEPLPNALNAATPPYSAATRGEQQGSAFGGTSIAANWPHVGSANEAAVADDLPKFEFASDMVLRPGPPPGPPPPGSQPALHTVQHISAAGPHTAPPLHGPPEANSLATPRVGLDPRLASAAPAVPPSALRGDSHHQMAQQPQGQRIAGSGAAQFHAHALSFTGNQDTRLPPTGPHTSIQIAPPQHQHQLQGQQQMPGPPRPPPGQPPVGLPHVPPGPFPPGHPQLPLGPPPGHARMPQGEPSGLPLQDHHRMMPGGHDPPRMMPGGHDPPRMMRVVTILSDDADPPPMMRVVASSSMMPGGQILPMMPGGHDPPRMMPGGHDPDDAGDEAGCPRGTRPPLDDARGGNVLVR